MNTQEIEKMLIEKIEHAHQHAPEAPFNTYVDGLIDALNLIRDLKE